jgi:hypothetical protein
MWLINDEDVESLRDSTECGINVHQPLAAPSGLYIQPYCASVPMPPEILSRYAIQLLPSLNILMHVLCTQIQASWLYDGQSLA